MLGPQKLVNITVVDHATTTMLFRFIVLDVTHEGSMFGTNNRNIAENYSVLDNYVVLDALTSTRIKNCETLDIEGLH